MKQKHIYFARVSAFEIKFRASQSLLKFQVKINNTIQFPTPIHSQQNAYLLSMSRSDKILIVEIIHAAILSSSPSAVWSI